MTVATMYRLLHGKSGWTTKLNSAQEKVAARVNEEPNTQHSNRATDNSLTN